MIKKIRIMISLILQLGDQGLPMAVLHVLSAQKVRPAKYQG